MNFFVLFIVMAVVLGAGAMLAPVWATREPRIGTSAAFCLALISGGAVFWAFAFGWDTLVIDYLLFGLMSFVVLGGTLSSAQARAEASGDDEFHEDDQHWISRADLVFMSIIGLICAIPLFVLVVPLTRSAITDAFQTRNLITTGYTGFGEYNSFTTLAAYLSNQLNLPIPTVHLGLGAAFAWLCIWAMYDLGAEIRDVRLGRAMALAMLLTGGVFVLQWASLYSLLMATLFTIAFMTYALRYGRQHNWLDLVASGLMLGAVLFTSPMLFGVVIGVYYMWLIWSFIQSRIAPRKQAPTADAKLKLFGQWVGIPLVMLIATSPYLLNTTIYLNAVFSLHYMDLVEGIIIGIIPVSMITGYVCLRLYDLRPQRQTRKFKMAALTAGLVLNVVLWGVLLPLGIVARDYVQNNDVFAGQSRDDFRAIVWMNNNTDANSSVLFSGKPNYWYELVSERYIVLSSSYEAFGDTIYGIQLEYPRHHANIIGYIVFSEHNTKNDFALLDEFEVIPELVFQSGDAGVYRIVDEE